MKPDITLLMPAYHGDEFIAETIRSILNQSYERWHLHISVDDMDEPTAELARGFSDARIRVDIQDRRLGWPGNFNWLISQVKTPFACYWQQDDLASTTYLEDLRSELIVSTDASISYTDVQWFGASFERTSLPSNTGTDLMRTMSFIEDIRYEPLRGLIRMSDMPSWPDVIPVADPETTQEEFVLLTALASAGEFRRVHSAMYFKRRHATNTYLKWLDADSHRVRNAWLSMGAGMARIALDLAQPHQHRTVILAVLDRLTIERPGRAFWFQTAQTESELSRFVHDFALTLDRDLGTDERLENDELFRNVDERLAVALNAESRMIAARGGISEQIEAIGTSTVSPMADRDRFHAVLGTGWSGIEEWGVWSDGPAAQIILPETERGLATVAITAVCFGESGSRIVDIGIDDRETQPYEVDASGTHITVELPAEAICLTIRPRNPLSPRHAGMSTDERLLGIGLQLATFTGAPN